MEYDVDLHRPAHSFTQFGRQTDLSFYSHLHYQLEAILVLSGELHMEIDSVPYDIPAGDAVFIQPFEPHSFSSPHHNESLVMEFPREIVRPFFDFLQYHAPKKRQITVSPELWDYLRIRSALHPDELQAMAKLAPLCLEFREKGEYTDGKKRFEDVFLEALSIIHEGFLEDVTLADTARRLGIYPETLSRKFYEISGVHFNTYVQSLRVTRAASLMKAGSTATEAAMNSGFGSVRSFNRVFRSMTGLTPTEYLASDFDISTILKV